MMIILVQTCLKKGRYREKASRIRYCRSY
ncbi:hypothetical protein Godav_004407 [Gossypium davidsonii]|uniref:Uncharacterized protein n=1 Tax=Gossypium davidsonii TaxID=34287 RepID=A0A7J8SMG4_GOSDV|nr:hypothetical protein [Gossypium davidsonii]